MTLSESEQGITERMIVLVVSEKEAKRIFIEAFRVQECRGLTVKLRSYEYV